MTTMRGTTAMKALLQDALRRIPISTPADELRRLLPDVFEAVGCEQYGGQVTAVRWRKPLSDERAQREKRVEAALAAGEAPESIAQREDLSKRHVRRIRARFA